MKENLDLELQTKANLASELQTIFEQRKELDRTITELTEVFKAKTPQPSEDYAEAVRVLLQLKRLKNHFEKDLSNIQSQIEAETGNLSQMEIGINEKSIDQSKCKYIEEHISKNYHSLHGALKDNAPTRFENFVNSSNNTMHIPLSLN